MASSARRAIAVATAQDDAVLDMQRVDHIAALGMSAPLVRPPVFYQNKFGVVTNRRQFRHYFEQNSVQPIGPYIWTRY